jgi:hypothetical protein
LLKIHEWKGIKFSNLNELLNSNYPNLTSNLYVCDTKLDFYFSSYSLTKFIKKCVKQVITIKKE